MSTATITSPERTTRHGAGWEAVSSAAHRQPLRPTRREAVSTLHSLVAAVEAENVASAGHSARVAELARELARLAGWAPERADRLHEAALVHDAGKLALRREVLGKPAQLTDDEYEHVKAHAELGARMVSGVLDEEQTRWVREHHERWDGRGYPFGLDGREISEGGALLAMADSYDAMTSPRAYKPGMSVEEALADARANAGRQFSPAAVDHLLRAQLRG